MAIVALLGMTLTSLAPPAAAWDLTCDGPRIRPLGTIDVSGDLRCKEGSDGGGGQPPLEIPCSNAPCPVEIPCYNAECPYVPCVDYDCGLPQVNVRILSTDQQVTDRMDGTAVPNDPPVAYVGTIRLLIGGTKITAVGVGVSHPCDAYENIFPCELNTLVPPTALFANVPEIEPGATDVPNLCLQSARLEVDMNDDGFNEEEVPTPWVGQC